MKTHFLLSTLLLAAFPVAAQSLSSGDVISRSPTTPPGSTQSSVTNAAGDNASLDQVAGQLRDLYRAVEETLPLLNSLSQSNSATGETSSTSGGLGGILGSILNHTNQTSGDG